MRCSLLFIGFLCHFVILLIPADSIKNNIHRNVSELLDELLQGYDNSIRPDFGGQATIVDIDIVVRSMGPISEIEMSYSMDCYFRQSWKDPRLIYKSYEKGTLALSISMLERICYFYNGKQSYLHTITTPNKFVRLSRDGTVLYSSRLTIKASCRMNLETFPMDVQRCPLKLGSFGYTTKDLLYRWNLNRTVDIAKDMKMSQFDLISNPSGNSTEYMKSGLRSVLEVRFYLKRHAGYFLLQVYFPCILLVHVSFVSFWINREASADRITLVMNEKLRLGEFSFLSVSFHLQRHMGNFLIQVYGPCTLLVVMSWVSFWLNREATAERVSLGITTILTMTFLGLEARTDLPKVSYPTALDFFVFLSFLFIFATIIQFAIVHYFTKYGSGEDYFIEETSSEEEAEEEEEEAEDEPENERELDEEQLGGLRRYEGGPMSIIGLQSGFNNGGMGRRFAANQQQQYQQTRSRSSRLRLSARNRAEQDRKRERREIAQAQRQLEFDSVNSVSKIDIFARIAFPLSFFLINVFYWYSYLYTEQIE